MLITIENTRYIKIVLTPNSFSEVRAGTHVRIVRKDLGKFSIYKILKLGHIGDGGINDWRKVHASSKGGRDNVVNNVPVSINPNKWPILGVGESVSCNFCHDSWAVKQTVRL